MAHPTSIPESMTMDSVSTDPNAASFDSVADDVFSRIASRYDLLCDLFSLGIHRIWKRPMARRIAAARWDNMLDVAAGTGDIALRVIRQLDGATTRGSLRGSQVPDSQSRAWPFFRQARGEKRLLQPIHDFPLDGNPGQVACTDSWQEVSEPTGGLRRSFGLRQQGLCCGL